MHAPNQRPLSSLEVVAEIEAIQIARSGVLLFLNLFRDLVDIRLHQGIVDRDAMHARDDTACVLGVARENGLPRRLREKRNAGA